MCTATAPDVRCVYVPKCVWKEVKVKCLLSASLTSTMSGKALNYTVRANSEKKRSIVKQFFHMNYFYCHERCTCVRACLSSVYAACGSALELEGERKREDGLIAREEGCLERRGMQGGTRWKGASSKYCSNA